MKGWARKEDRGLERLDWIGVAAYCCVGLSTALHAFYVLVKDAGDAAASALSVLAAALVFSVIYSSMTRSLNVNERVKGRLTAHLDSTRANIDRLETNLNRLDEARRD